MTKRRHTRTWKRRGSASAALVTVAVVLVYFANSANVRADARDRADGTLAAQLDKVLTSYSDKRVQFGGCVIEL